jgi:hypothetical protein
MSYCPKCGASVDPNATFCQYCGTTISQSPGSQPPPSSPPPASPASYSSNPYTTPVSRPTGITILAILAALGGLALIVFGAVTAFTGIGLIFVVIGLIEFGVAYGYWTGASWGWYLGIIGAILDILSIVTLNVVALLIGIIMLYYLTRPNVKVWFHKT